MADYDNTDVLHDVLSGAGLGGDSSKLTQSSTDDKGSNANTPTNQSVSDGKTSSGGGAQQGTDQNTQTTIDDATFERVLTDRFKLSPAEIQERLQNVDRQKQLLEASPYKSTIGAALDDLLSRNIEPEIAIRYLKTDINAMDDRDVIALSMRLENPNLTEQEVSRLIDRKYGLGDYKKSDTDEEDGKILIKMDAGPLRTKSQELKDKMLQTGANREQIAAEHLKADRIKSWNQAKSNLESDFSKLEIAIAFDKDGKPIETLPFAIKNRAELEREFETIINSMPNLKADEQGIKLVKQIIRDRAVLSNLPNIIRTALTTSRSQNDQWWANYLDNPSLGNPNGTNKATSTGGKSSDEQLAEQFLKFYGQPK